MRNASRLLCVSLVAMALAVAPSTAPGSPVRGSGAEGAFMAPRWTAPAVAVVPAHVRSDLGRDHRGPAVVAPRPVYRPTQWSPFVARPAHPSLLRVTPLAAAPRAPPFFD